ncbi:MAG: hypothetical protein KDC61_13455, partial [Saprospiraceae bacterium]|nr:hypothetical protein [Saprospiraceae bacterium]
MNNLLLTLLLALSATSGLSAQECPYYNELMQKAKTYWAKGDFDKALNQLTAAREHCPDKSAEVDAQFVSFTRDIASKYREADIQRLAAERQTLKADSTATAAQRAALYAYANDLAYKSQIALRDGDRTAAFRLAEFAYRFVDNDNINVTRALVAALYYDNDLDPMHRLFWAEETLSGHTDDVWSVAFSA